MTDLGKILDTVNRILHAVGAPSWVSLAAAWLALIAIVVAAAWGLLKAVSGIIELWTQKIRPRNPEQRLRSRRRQRFAFTILGELERRDNAEEWSDYRFAELEAEVEAEIRRVRRQGLPFTRLNSSGLRREKSLSKALSTSRDRLILVEGEPGSGKSVALRHVARAMAQRAAKSKSTKSLIPLYVNLRELERPDDVDMSPNLIEEFVLQSINRVNSREVKTFLDDEFRQGLDDDSWFFLFDAFDELPDVLGSTEADITIQNYSNAISGFLTNMNHCRGIVASRQYRGPKRLNWPRFRIVPLSGNRQKELIRRMELRPRLEREFIGQLGTATDEVRTMADNPLFLNLLCEHAKEGLPFPSNSYTVFDSFVKKRLDTAKADLLQRFKLCPEQVRAGAEKIAFCMTSNKTLGLSSTPSQLQQATINLGMDLGDTFDPTLKALEYIKLARLDQALDNTHSTVFTFSHRRFQEYFATRVTLREAGKVSPKQLLTDARWRETAVVMCQTRELKDLLPIIKQAQRLLADFWAWFRNKVTV